MSQQLEVEDAQLAQKDAQFAQPGVAAVDELADDTDDGPQDEYQEEHYEDQQQDGFYDDEMDAAGPSSGVGSSRRRSSIDEADGNPLLDEFEGEELEEGEQQQPKAVATAEAEAEDIVVQQVSKGDKAKGGAKGGAKGFKGWQGEGRRGKKRKVFLHDGPTQLTDEHIKACIADTSDITDVRPLHRRYLRMGEVDELSLTMAERFARPTFHKGLAPALLKMYRELMTPGLFPFAQAKMQKKRAAEDEEPEEAGGEDTGELSEGEARGEKDGEKINDESFQQDDNDQFGYDEQNFQQDDNDFPEEDGVHRRDSYLSEDGHDPSQPALEEDDEAQLEDGEQGAKSERKKKMPRHQMHFLRLFGRNFEKRERPTFQKIVPKSTGARDAALLFHELLAAKTKDLVEVEQDEPYGAIYVTKVKKNFDRAVADMQPVA